MKLKSFSTLLLLIAFLVTPLTTFSQENEIQENTLLGLFVQDLEISLDENIISGSFNTINDENAAVGGINYIIMIISDYPDIPEGEIIGDNPFIYSYEYVDANLALAANEERGVSFTHTIPTLPQGDETYRVRIQLVTSNGRSLGWNDQEITLSGTSTNFINLLPLSVLAESTDPYVASLLAEIDEDENDTDEPTSPYDENLPEMYRESLNEFLNSNETSLENMLHRSEWEPLEGPNVDPGTEVGLRTQFNNLGENTVTGNLTISFRRTLTNTTQLESQILSSITIDPNAEIIQDIPFTAPETPGVYEIFLTVNDNASNSISTIGEYRLVVRGPSASVIGVKADELRLNEGDNVVLNVTAIGSADRETVLQGKLDITMLDGDTPVGHVQSSIQLDSLRRDATANITLDRTIETTPGARIIISDNDNNILDIYEVEFSRDAALTFMATDKQILSDNALSLVMGLVALLIILIVGSISSLIYRRIKNGGNRPPSGYTTVGILTIFTLSGILMYYPQVNAFHQNSLKMYDNRQGVTYERVGDKLSVTIDKGKRSYSIFVNSPKGPLLDADVGKTVRYSAHSATHDACANLTANNLMWVHVAKNGGHHNRHHGVPWSNQASLSTKSYSASAAKSGISRTLIADINIGDHLDEEGKATIWTESWWLKVKDSEIRRARFTFLLTPLTVQTPEPPKQPDLIANNLSSSDCKVGQPVKLEGFIKNIGERHTEASSKATFQINNETISTMDVPPLNAGDLHGINTEWTPTSPGTYTFTVCADANNEIDESNENNNCHSSAAFTCTIPLEEIEPENYCSPSSQTVKTNQLVSFSSLLEENTKWSAPGGYPSFGNGTNFVTSFETPGEKVVSIEGFETAYLDVNGDGYITNEDAELVIDHLNRISADGSAAPEPGSGAPWQNQTNRFDVNNDGQVSPLDSLLIINHINRHGETVVPNLTCNVTVVATEEPLDKTPQAIIDVPDYVFLNDDITAISISTPSDECLSSMPPPYLDVNGDGIMNGEDAQLIIDHLNRTVIDGPSVPQPGSGALWQNQTNRLDVNNDGRVSPIDALLVINQFNRHGELTLPQIHTPDTPPYLDVNGDGYITNEDAELVIDHLNRISADGSAAPEPGSGAPWQNQTNRFDVNNDGSVSPLDSLLIINHVNRHGEQALGDCRELTNQWTITRESDNVNVTPDNNTTDQINIAADQVTYYEFQLTVTDIRGNQDTTTKRVEVRERTDADTPTGSTAQCIPSSQSIAIGEQVTFENGFGDPTAWEAPGGTPNSGEGASFSTTFNTIGTKTVSASYSSELYLDVNGDRMITSEDAELVIDHVNRTILGESTNPIPGSGSPWQNQTNRLDVNNDGQVTPIDAILIINRLISIGNQPLLRNCTVTVSSITDPGDDPDTDPTDPGDDPLDAPRQPFRPGPIQESN